MREHPLDKLIAHYSDFYRLKKAVAWMVRWVRCMRCMRDADTKNHSGLSVDKLKEAECSLLKRAQEVCYREEVDSVVSSDSISRSSHILSLDPVLSHGLLVVEHNCGLMVEDSWALMVEDSWGLMVEIRCGLAEVIGCEVCDSVSRRLS